MKIVSGVIQNAFEYWKISDVFIRPTTTDIEGISVKEALWVNTPAIASDVCRDLQEHYFLKTETI